MKKPYTKPFLSIESFTPNEFISSCGDSGTVYKFQCNAGDPDRMYAVKDSTGNVATISGMYMSGDRRAGGSYFYPCEKAHDAEIDSVFLTGYHIDDISTPEDENIPVTIWTENNTDCHCTTILDQSQWEVAKS